MLCGTNMVYGLGWYKMQIYAIASCKSTYIWNLLPYLLLRLLLHHRTSQFVLRFFLNHVPTVLNGPLYSISHQWLHDRSEIKRSEHEIYSLAVRPMDPNLFIKTEFCPMYMIHTLILKSWTLKYGEPVIFVNISGFKFMLCWLPQQDNCPCFLISNSSSSSYSSTGASPPYAPWESYDWNITLLIKDYATFWLLLLWRIKTLYFVARITYRI